MKKNVRIATALGTALGLMTAGIAYADAPKLSEVLESSGITATGYVAASAYRFDTDSGSQHQFDVDHSTFSLDQAALTIAYQPADGFGALVGLIAGQDAQILNFSAENPAVGGQVAVPQAFVQYKTGGFTIMAGKMLTLAGAEVIAPTGNTNFSRGLVFFELEPLFHTGIRASFAPMDTLTFTLGVNNGWNNSFDTASGNSNKTIEAGVSFAPIKQFSFAVNGYFGNESPNGTTGATNLIDILATFAPNEMLSFILNYDMKRVKDVGGETLKSDGFALYGNVAFNEQWRASLRLEQVKDDSNGGLISGIPDHKIKEATLTLGFMPSASAEVRFEVRRDKADDDAFFTKFSGDPSSTQTEFAIQGIYKF